MPALSPTKPPTEEDWPEEDIITRELPAQPTLKDLRKEQWKETIEAGLQQLIIEAAKIRKNITEAKTKTKAKYFQKKFDKVSAQVRQYVAALQRLGTPILPEGTEDDGTNTNIHSTNEE